MRRLAQWCFAILTAAALSVYLPLLYDKLFLVDVARTHLLYSPVLEEFIWKEKVADPPPEARAKAEDHHAEFVYKDESGRYYSREAFERQLPFIYYKNMELWGLLPLELHGRTFTVADIRDNRRVLELQSEEIRGRASDPGLYPLLESAPEQARLVFPEDRYRLAPDGLEFVNADVNAVDEALSARFTTALEDAGFTFPARFVAGKHTILKPHDAGHFLVDATGAVFHLKRVAGEPWVRRTPIDPALDVAHIEISESRRRDYLGLLLTADDRLFLLKEEGYGLVELPLEGYAPERMDFKVIMNPLYYTAVLTDERIVRGVAATLEGDTLAPVRRYSHTMARAERRTAHVIRDALFPFTLTLKDEGFVTWRAQPGGWISLIGLGVSAACFLMMRRSRRELLPRTAFVAVTGVFGLAAGLLAFDE